MNKKFVKKEIDFAGKKLSFETGELAGQANMAVKASYGDTVVLATVVSGGLIPDMDYFPLSVVYEEKLYASGSIKSSRFMKRDGRPTDSAVVTRRLIDHAIRPLFPDDFSDDIQVVLTVLSLDPDSDPEFLSMLAASAVLHASDIPWNGPMTTAKVGYVNGDYVLSPSRDMLEHESELDMVVSFVGDEQEFLAIECSANILTESKVLGAIEYARNNLGDVLKLINDFAEEVNPGLLKYEYEKQVISEELRNAVAKHAKTRMEKVFDTFESRENRRKERGLILAELETEYEETYKKPELEKALFEIEKKIIQNRILEKNQRPDGRKIAELRELSCSVAILPRTHGSAIFNRGETQAMTVATLGNPSDELLIQDMHGERSKRYLHYYNFPPYSTGETGRFGSPGGREIGHGMLAEKALIPVMPGKDEFPYMIILMTEILSSNGSTSMAATCGSTLALMDAGVPIKEMVAGISIGLVSDKENDKYILLTDIIGLEDFAGHMDFKITGTKSGITAIQLDMKVRGIPMELLPKVFEQSKEARLQILDVMEKTIAHPKGEISKYAPKMKTVKVDPSQVGMIIGAGGKTIKDIQERTDTELGIEDDGTVYISGTTQEGVDRAASIVEGMTKDIEPGEVYKGTVTGITDFGAFVEILPGRTGLLHVSEISHEYIKSVEDHLKIGDIFNVKVIDTSRDGKIALSKKALEPHDGPIREKPHNKQDKRRR